MITVKSHKLDQESQFTLGNVRVWVIAANLMCTARLNSYESSFIKHNIFKISAILLKNQTHWSAECTYLQSYEIKSPPWTIWWFRILVIFSVENIDRLGAMMCQTSDNSQLCIDSQYSSQQLTIVWSLIHHSTQPILIFSRVRVLHLDRLKEGTWLHSFDIFRVGNLRNFWVFKAN